MGHYDECRDGYCPECGQSWGNCRHTKGVKDIKALQEKNGDGVLMSKSVRRRLAIQLPSYTITGSQFEDLCVYLEKCRTEPYPGDRAEYAEKAQQILKEVETQGNVCPKVCPKLGEQLQEIAKLIGKDKSLTHPCSHGLRTCCEFCSIPCEDREAEKR